MCISMKNVLNQNWNNFSWGWEGSIVAQTVNTIKGTGCNYSILTTQLDKM